MTKGITVNFKSYQETIPKIFDLIKLEGELKKYDKIILMPGLRDAARTTNPDFAEIILRFCLAKKNPVAEIFIAGGADGTNTLDLFEQQGYKKLAEKYAIGLVDLNESESQMVNNVNFQKFQGIKYPGILLDSFVISLTSLHEDPEVGMTGSIANMLQAFPAQHYTGFFASSKNKIRKWPIKYSIFDIVQCKMPNLAVIDASDKGKIVVGKPLEADRQAAKILGKESRDIAYLRLFDEISIKQPVEKTEEAEKLVE